ncbi:MAG: type I 3-dehydroquinate dehydratase [Planctomycetes bacterium]|nr:type I 3-dehydroquinate dehydratase [Planctomycetota bacterium]
MVTLPARAASCAEDYARRAHETGADLLEIRGDLCPDLSSYAGPLPLLVAPRGRGQEFVDRFAPRFVDVEVGETISPPLGAGLIRSAHDHDRVPETDDLLRLIRSLAEESDMVKVAARPRTHADLARLESVRSQAAIDRPLALLAMGPLAWPSRMHAAKSDPLVYACLEPADAAAPGQVPLAALLRVDGEPRLPLLFGLLGAAGTKSLSPLIHNSLFDFNGMEAFYGLLAGDDLEGAIAVAEQFGFEGLSVTSPWKRAVFERCRETSDEARRHGSVNTLVRDGQQWVGHQTDRIGFEEGYPDLAGRGRAAVVGSGGVVPSVIAALKNLGVGEIRVYARNGARRAHLARDFDVESGRLERLGEDRVDLLVWCLPVDADELALPGPRGAALALDLRYGRASSFAARCAASGFAYRDGLAMLLHQAFAQFRLWTGRTPQAADLATITARCRSQVG